MNTVYALPCYVFYAMRIMYMPSLCAVPMPAMRVILFTHDVLRKVSVVRDFLWVQAKDNRYCSEGLVSDAEATRKLRKIVKDLKKSGIEPEHGDIGSATNSKFLTVSLHLVCFVVSVNSYAG